MAIGAKELNLQNEAPDNLPTQTRPYARPTRKARTSSGPNSPDASAINVPAQMAKMAVILRVIILRIPCVNRDDEAAPASFPDDCVEKAIGFVHRDVIYRGDVASASKCVPSSGRGEQTNEKPAQDFGIGTAALCYRFCYPTLWDETKQGGIDGCRPYPLALIFQGYVI